MKIGNKTLALLVTVAGLLIGSVAGFFYGVRSVQSITTSLTRKGELVCGTGLVFFPFFFAIFGMVLGAATGLIAGLVIWLSNLSKGKSDFAAYYGE